MKLPIDSSYEFHGQVKYTGGTRGSVVWKSGSLLFTRTETCWNVDMLLDCVTSGRPILSQKLFPGVVQKVVCRNTFFMDLKMENGLLTWYLKPTSSHAMGQIQAIMDDVQKPSAHSADVKSEVSVKKGISPGRTSQTNTDKENMDGAAHKFTSVKENRRTDRESDMWQNDEGKENRIRSTDRSNDQFLQRSGEKSRECLKTLSFYSKSPSSSAQIQLPSKRPGLMPDPIPIKRSRLSDAIPYSMKTKLTTPTDQKSTLTLQGFSNLGNTCYMNAILQSLFGLDSFSTDLTANRKILKLLPMQSLYSAMVKLLYARRQPSDLARKDCLRRVKSAISTSVKRFSGYGQHDAHEFLGQVLDQLKEEVLKVYKATPSPSSNPAPAIVTDHSAVPDSPAHQVLSNPITVNFEFEVLHTLTCLQCGEQVTKAEQFHDISLDVPKGKDIFTPRSLQDAVSMFFRNEHIEYTCEKCGHGKSDVSHKITRLPRVFILHLKRYNYNQTVSKHTKMAQNVSIPLYLTLDHHCTEATQPAHPPTLQHTPPSEEKSAIGSDIADDSEPNSRRKLDYQQEHSGYKFHKKEHEGDRVVPEGTFTETKDKKDGSEPSARRTLTLEDEDDLDIARAIEISLKEQEEKDQMRRDYGEDTTDNIERVLEMSRTRHEDEQLSARSKNFNDLSEEEMMQLAIEQSLQENDPCHRGDGFQTDNHDHNYIQHDIDVNKMSFLHVDTTSLSNNNNINGALNDDIAMKEEAVATNSPSRNPGFDGTERTNWSGIGFSTPRPMASMNDPESDTTFSPIMMFGGEFCRGDQTAQVDFKDSRFVKDWTRKHGQGQGIDLSTSESIEDFPVLDILKNVKTDIDRCKKGNKSGSSSDSTLSVLSAMGREILQSNSLSDLDENMNEMKCDSSGNESGARESARYGGGDGRITAARTGVNGSNTTSLNGDAGRTTGAGDNNCSTMSRTGVTVSGETSAAADDDDNQCSTTSSVAAGDGNNDSTTSSVGAGGNKCSTASSVDAAGDYCTTSSVGGDTCTTSSVGPSGGGTTAVNTDCIMSSKVETADMDLWTDLPDLEDLSTEDEVGSNSVGKLKLPEKREANVRNIKMSDAATGTMDDLLCDEDDSWLSSIDDKENKLPLTTEQPRLSAPDEFVIDDNTGNMADEVDGEGEETPDLPVIDNEKGDLPYTYRLVSIVNHMGVSSNTGHYLSDVYDLKKKAWYSLDDSYVVKTTETNVRTQRERSGYIFFYMSGDIFDDIVLHHATAPQSAEQKLRIKKRVF